MLARAGALASRAPAMAAPLEVSSRWCHILVAAFVASGQLWPITAAGATQRWELDIPRVTRKELESNSTLRSGLHAYVLTDWVGSRWKASNWTLDYLKKKIPFEWVDYYPNNMEDVGNKPYLFKLEEAMPKFQQAGGPKYMQMRIGYRGWTRLKKDLDPKPLPDIFWDDDEWIGKCMKKQDGKVDKPAIDNFFVTNQWKFLLIGEKGTSMFFHKDGTAASSWQAQVLGRKSWTLCPNTESHLLDVHLNTYKPDYNRFPKFAKALCGQVTVSPGELLYYPAYWWHHTLQLETPSVAYTGALVGVEAERRDLGGERKPHARFFRDLMDKCDKCWERGNPTRKCDDISEKWPGAAPPPLRVICETYLMDCYKEWDAHAKSLHGAAKSEL
mmetsp:Transcript_32895/g.83292  ORF Transcript_32895/g.83292 Transcript_32895/m.83292 type:complete len:386 (-) Transcript_32895:118-1275(-)